MHILIIGAAGMVGRKLTARLVKDGRVGGKPIDALDTGRRGRARGAGGLHRQGRHDSRRPVGARRCRRRLIASGPTSSSISPPSSRARRKPISRRATASISTGRAHLFEAIRQEGLKQPYKPRARLHLLDRGVRRAVPRQDRRRVLHHAADQLRHAEGDRRTAALRLFAARLLRRHRHPPADHLHPAGQAQQGGLRLLLQHPARAARRPGGGAAGRRRRCATGIASPRAGGRLPAPCDDDGLAVLGARRNLTMPGLSATVGEQIEALRRVAGDKAVQLIRREPDPTIGKIVAGWPRNFDARRAHVARLQGGDDLRRDHPRPYRGRTGRQVIFS